MNSFMNHCFMKLRAGVLATSAAATGTTGAPCPRATTCPPTTNPTVARTAATTWTPAPSARARRSSTATGAAGGATAASTESPLRRGLGAARARLRQARPPRRSTTSCRPTTLARLWARGRRPCLTPVLARRRRITAAPAARPRPTAGRGRASGRPRRPCRTIQARRPSAVEGERRTCPRTGSRSTPSCRSSPRRSRSPSRSSRSSRRRSPPERGRSPDRGRPSGSSSRRPRTPSRSPPRRPSSSRRRDEPSR